jgi:hypothetical protein
VSTRCQFVESARRCSVVSLLYPYCADHLRKACGLEVRTSTVPGAGLGLFYVGTSEDGVSPPQPLKKGVVITEYSGSALLTDDEYNNLYPLDDSAYGLCVSPDVCLDSGSTDNYPGRYINHRSHSRANVQWGRKVHRMSCGRYAVYIYTTKRIKPGSELFIDYGPTYWRLSSQKPS